MLIVCAGRSRSGSTLLYNLVRLTLVELFGEESVYGRGIGFYRRKDERKYNVVKLHDSQNKYFELTADYVFSSNRSEKDQRESILKFRKIIKNQSLSKRELDAFINYDYRRYKKWSSHKNFVKTFKYNTLVNDKKKIIREICKAMNFKIKDDTIKIIIRKVNNLQLPSKEEKRDPVTALTWHHITREER
jgi:hypothetical protein